MKKFFTIALALLMLGGIIGQAEARWDKYEIEVYAWRGTGIPSQLTSLDHRRGLDSSGSAEAQITYKVLYRNTDTAASIASNYVGTSKTNPVTTTVFSSSGNRKIRFWINRNVDSNADGDWDEDDDYYSPSGVDLIVTDVRGGYTATAEDVVANKTHTLIIDERPNILHSGVIWFDATASEVDTGIDFEYDTIIKSVSVEVLTVSDGGTLDVGLLSDDPDGFFDGLELTILGYRYDSGGTPGATTAQVGDLLGTSERTYDHVIEGSGSQSLTYTGSSAVGAGYLHYEFIHMR